METSESSVEDIGTESKVNGDESNAEPVDANETVMDSNSQDANNEITDNYQKVGIKRKADENIIEISQKIPKIDNSSISDKSSKNGDDENGQEDSVNSDGIDLDSSSNSQTEEKDISKSESITDEKDEKPNDETLDTVNKTSEESVESRSEDAITKSEDNITKNEVPNMIKSEDKLEESPKQKLQKSPQTPTEATRQSVRANRNSNPAAFLVKKPKLPTDMSNPAYKEPFKYGWRRELVYRANSESGPKRNGDIYYFTPDGKKVRSMREVLENLKNKELSTENFTFYKEPLGMNNPELEIIRVAKVKGVPTPTTGFTPSKKVLKVKEKQKVIEKPIITKSKTPKFGNALKVKFSGARLSQGKRSLSNSSKSDKKNKSAKTQLQMGTLPPGWQSPSKKNSEKLQGGSTLEKVKLTEQCSIRCKGVDPVVPTLQCSLCLCLYHPECVGLTPLIIDVQEHYVCKNCQPEEETFKDGEAAEAVSSLPPLTPFSAIKTHAPISTIPPRLHKINTETLRDSPKKSSRSSKLLNPPRHLKLNDTSNLSGNYRPETSKSIVGSVTTWLQPSSQIQMIQSNSESIASLTNNTESAQSQATIGGRKFIIIPKQNLLSIHPNEQTNVVPPSENAQTPSTINSLDTVPVPSATDKLSDTAASLGPLTYNSEVITITTNNAHSHQASQPVLPLEHSLPESPSPVDIHSRTLWQKDGGPQLKQLNTSVPEKVSARSKRNSQRMSSSSTQSSTDRSEKTKVETLEKEQYMQNFLSHVSVGYSVLFQVFQYLKVQELLRASRVCRMWRDIASNSALWRIVRMKNSQVRDWEGLVTSLKRYGTVSLDLRKMLIPGNGDEMWTTFSNEIGNADSLRKIDLCKCPAIVVEQLANSNSNLEIINAVAIRCTTIDLSMYTKLQNLRELRLKSQTGINLKDDFSFLEHLKQLRHLSLLSFKDLGKKNIEKIANLIDLESLELGECDGLSENFGTDVLSKFENIEKLRLEKGPSGSSTYNILESISKLSKLQQIELVNFDVKPGFDEALALCTNIKRLLLIPTYITQSATTNNMVLNGIFQLSGSLTHFIWGVTLELLRVTELFIDQCDQTPKKKTPPKKDKKGSGDSIPILKPVPFMEDSKSSSDTIQDNTQVEILSLQALQKLLTNKLQATKVKILKIPFHATWRQSITDVIQ